MGSCLGYLSPTTSANATDPLVSCLHSVPSLDNLPNRHDNMVVYAQTETSDGRGIVGGSKVPFVVWRQTNVAHHREVYILIPGTCECPCTGQRGT